MENVKLLIEFINFIILVIGINLNHNIYTSSDF